MNEEEEEFIDDDDRHPTKQEEEEDVAIHNSASTTKTKRRKILFNPNNKRILLVGLVGIVLLMLLALAIGLGLGFSSRNRSSISKEEEEEEETPIEPSNEPSSSPSVTITPLSLLLSERMEIAAQRLESILQKDGLSFLINRSILADKSTVHYQALYWLTYNDTYNYSSTTTTTTNDDDDEEEEDYDYDYEEIQIRNRRRTTKKTFLTQDYDLQKATRSLSSSSFILEETYFLERYVFALVYYALDGPNWLGRQHNFLTNSSVCEWHTKLRYYDDDSNIGVTCLEQQEDDDEDDEEVNHNIVTQQQRKILFKLSGFYHNEHDDELISQPLTGSVPSELFVLSNLIRIQFSWPSFALTTTIPTHLSRIAPSLQTLHLESWQNKAPVPTQIGQLTRLTSLGLYGEGWTGTLPTELGLLSLLTHLGLAGGSWTGTIPTELGRLSSIYQFQLFGRVERAIMMFSAGPDNDDEEEEEEEEVDDLNSNVAVSGQQRILNVTGTIPSELFSLSELTWFWIRDTHIQGPLPTEIGISASLQFIFLEDNPSLSGRLPTEVGKMSQLTRLQLTNNDLSGPLPSEIGSLSFHFGYLDLSGNRFSGVVPWAYRYLVGRENQWSHIYLHSNDLEGDMDPIFCDSPVNGTILSFPRAYVSADCADTPPQQQTGDDYDHNKTNSSSLGWLPAPVRCSCCKQCHSQQRTWWERCMSGESCKQCGFNRTYSSCINCRVLATAYGSEGLWMENNDIEVSEESACGNISCQWNETTGVCQEKSSSELVV